MNIECVICLENLQATEEICGTPCGHVFHSPCVAQWFERSSTCPECRKEVPGKKLRRIFLNFVNESTITDELTSILETEIQGLKDQLSAKDFVIAEGIKWEKKLSEKNHHLEDIKYMLINPIRDKLEEVVRMQSNLQNESQRIMEMIVKLDEMIQ